jgi:hypothetical protein
MLLVFWIKSRLIALDNNKSREQVLSMGANELEDGREGTAEREGKCPGASADEILGEST